jgi:hypothetical protein
MWRSLNDHDASSPRLNVIYTMSRLGDATSQNKTRGGWRGGGNKRRARNSTSLVFFAPRSSNDDGCVMHSKFMQAFEGPADIDRASTQVASDAIDPLRSLTAPKSPIAAKAILLTSRSPVRYNAEALQATGLGRAKCE